MALRKQQMLCWWLVVWISFCCWESTSFSVLSPISRGSQAASIRTLTPAHHILPTTGRQTTTTTSTTALSGFLPPSGGGKSNDVQQIVTTVLTGLGIILFFASPLGALVFALFNSLLVLAILLPIGGVIALNVWQYFNTVTGTCPNCNAPVRVLKDESPNICFTCGEVIQAKQQAGDNDYVIALANRKQEYEPSVFSIFEEMGGVRQRPMTDRLGDERSSSRSKPTNVIDVDVERDDK